MKNSRIVLNGQNYATPHTESVEIMNQGVLCASGDPTVSSSGTGFTQFINTRM